MELVGLYVLTHYENVMRNKRRYAAQIPSTTSVLKVYLDGKKSKTNEMKILIPLTKMQGIL